MTPDLDAEPQSGHVFRLRRRSIGSVRLDEINPNPKFSLDLRLTTGGRAVVDALPIVASLLVIVTVGRAVYLAKFAIESPHKPQRTGISVGGSRLAARGFSLPEGSEPLLLFKVNHFLGFKYPARSSRPVP